MGLGLGSGTCATASVIMSIAPRAGSNTRVARAISLTTPEGNAGPLSQFNSLTLTLGSESEGLATLEVGSMARLSHLLITLPLVAAPVFAIGLKPLGAQTASPLEALELLAKHNAADTKCSSLPA